MLNIFSLHGIATTPDDRVRLGRRWRRSLADAGIRARVHVGQWESTGHALHDIVRVVGGRTFREAQVASVRDQIRQWVRAPREAGARNIILAHSLGQALAATALEEINDDLPIVSIGGPLGQPVFGRALRRVGLGCARPRSRAVDVYSLSDRVTSAIGEHETPDGWVGLRVSAGSNDPGLFREHPDRMYLEHALVHQVLRALAP